MKKEDILIAFALAAGMICLLNVKRSPSQQVVPTTSKEVAFGLDVSHNQNIDWQKLADQKKFRIEFIFIRATMGKDRKDKKFDQNWLKAKEKGYIVGAYHYYDPNENSIEQAKNYLGAVTLEKGNFLPVVDIEKLSKKQPKKRLLLGLRRWLDMVEKKYGVKPIIYSGHTFFRENLLKEFSDYPLWVAAYSQERRADPIVGNAAIHQFSEKVRVPGITGNTVDGNDIKRSELGNLLIP